MRKNLKRIGILRALIAAAAFIIYINVTPPADTLSFIIFYLLTSVTLFLFFTVFVSREIALLSGISINVLLILKQLDLLYLITAALILSLYATLLLYIRDQ